MKLNNLYLLICHELKKLVTFNLTQDINILICNLKSSSVFYILIYIYIK